MTGSKDAKPFKITHKELKRCDLITLSGRIDGSKAPDVEKLFKELMDQGRFKFVVDMTDVEFAASAFLRVMISTMKTTKRWNRGNVYLANLQPRIANVFDLAGLTPLFKIYETETEAVGAW